MTESASFLQYLAMGVGSTMLLAKGSIFARVRARLQGYKLTSDLLACSLCLGFWAGLLAAFVAYLRHDITLLALPLATSISAWLFEAVIDLLHTLELTLEEFRSRFRSER